MSPYRSDASSFYRSIGPLSYVAKHSEDRITVFYIDTTFEPTWETLIGYDIIFFHRPCRVIDVELMNLCCQMSIQTWIDYDDWLFEVPSWNPVAKYYQDERVQMNMIHMITHADLITCPTVDLYNRFYRINPYTEIVPNAYRDDLFSYHDPKTSKRNEVIVWRGSNTHEGDLLSVEQAWGKLPLPVVFIGEPPYSILSQMAPSQFKVYPAMPILEYFHFIYQLRPKIMVVPLQKCFFNDCKSNIAYIEGMHAGAVCVAPKSYEWIMPGCYNYTQDSSDSFLNKVNEVTQMGLADLDYIQDNRIRLLFNKYESIIDELIARSGSKLKYLGGEKNARLLINKIKETECNGKLRGGLWQEENQKQGTQES